MDFLDLLILALICQFLKVLLVTAVGLLLAMDRVNLLGPDARSHLNNMVFYVFGPALISSNLAETITWESLGTLWFMPVNILLTLILGLVLGWILIKITKTPPNLKGLIMGCYSAEMRHLVNGAYIKCVIFLRVDFVGFMCTRNMGILLLIILPELCEESSSPFGDSSTCSTNAEAYASLSLALLAIYGWSYVYIMMRVYANSEGNGIDKDERLVVITTSGGDSEELLESSREALLPSKGFESREKCLDQIEPPSHAIERREKGKVLIFLGKIKQHVNKLTSHIKLKMLLAPRTVATIVGFIIGLVSPLRKVLIGDSAHFWVIYSSTTLIGEAAIPSITLIITANLLKVPPAVNIGTISQLLGAGQSECSVIMLWTYAFASFFLTLWLSLFIWLVT
ncbi:hypothetical protein SLE2022_106730 [Rubroshorea leprosula]